MFILTIHNKLRRYIYGGLKIIRSLFLRLPICYIYNIIIASSHVSVNKDISKYITPQIMSTRLIIIYYEIMYVGIPLLKQNDCYTIYIWFIKPEIASL